jgi:hypothetical protein
LKEYREQVVVEATKLLTQSVHSILDDPVYIYAYMHIYIPGHATKLAQQILLYYCFTTDLLLLYY